MMNLKQIKVLFLRLKDAIAVGTRGRASELNGALDSIDYAVKSLENGNIVDLSDIWHQAKDKMPKSQYGGNGNMIMVIHQFKPHRSYPYVTCEVYDQDMEQYLKENPNDYWCYVGELLLKEHRELYNR